MKHFAIFLADLESERFLSASNDQIATWLFLHAFCSKQMNGGTIQGAATLPERFWSRHGINHDVMSQPSPLWSWIGDDLAVEPYDIGGQELYLKKSAGGKAGMEKRWNGTANKTLNKTLNRPDQTRPNHTIPDQTKKRGVSTFQKPTLEMVKEFGRTLTPPFTKAEDFMDYYESNGWKVGKNPMKSWELTVTRWNRNTRQAGQSSKSDHREVKAQQEFSTIKHTIPILDL